ncbi:energy transducer TonB [Kordiimonas pumila]|uniref:Energy transducer TonB n=1 Tax=Kordiimonas pumila TaxID=2161677 RepID=A0ABV7D6V8_9PROT|nr:energy transducer TonB [Kordiimonas pumila]
MRRHIILACAAVCTLVSLQPAFSAPQEGLNNWAAQVQKEIASNKHYPARAIKNGIEGKVMVRVTVMKTGQIKSVQMVSASGNHLLDSEAMRLAATLTGLPSLPEGLQEHTFELPISFILQGDKETKNNI